MQSHQLSGYNKSYSQGQYEIVRWLTWTKKIFEKMTESDFSARKKFLLGFIETVRFVPQTIEKI